MNIFKSFYDLEMSKKFAIVVLLVWIVSIAISYITNSVNPIMEYIQAGFMTVLISYFGKSGFENVTRTINNKTVSPTTVVTNATAKNNDGQV